MVSIRKELVEHFKIISAVYRHLIESIMKNMPSNASNNFISNFGDEVLDLPCREKANVLADAPTAVENMTALNDATCTGPGQENAPENFSAMPDPPTEKASIVKAPKGATSTDPGQENTPEEVNVLPHAPRDMADDKAPNGTTSTGPGQKKDIPPKVDVYLHVGRAYDTRRKKLREEALLQDSPDNDLLDTGFPGVRAPKYIKSSSLQQTSKVEKNSHKVKTRVNQHRDSLDMALKGDSEMFSTRVGGYLSLVQTKSNEQTLETVSFIFEKKEGILELRNLEELSDCISYGFSKAVTNLPEKFHPSGEDMNSSAFLEFFDTWGDSIITSQFVGGALEAHTNVNASDRKRVKIVRTGFHALLGKPTTGAETDTSGLKRKSSEVDISKYMTNFRLTGGIPFPMTSVSEITPEEWSTWQNSTRENPKPLPTHLGTKPLYHLIEVMKVNGAKERAEAVKAAYRHFYLSKPSSKMELRKSVTPWGRCLGWTS